MTLTVGSDQYQLDFGLCLRRMESLAARSNARCSLKTFTGFVAAGGGGENKGGWGMTLGACFEKSSLGKRVEDVAADIPFFLTQAVAAPKGRTDNRKKYGRLLQQHLGREGGSGVCWCPFSVTGICAKGCRGDNRPPFIGFGIWGDGRTQQLPRQK